MSHRYTCREYKGIVETNGHHYSGLRDITPILEQMEKKLDNEMETGIM